VIKKVTWRLLLFRISKICGVWVADAPASKVRAIFLLFVFPTETSLFNGKIVGRVFPQTDVVGCRVGVFEPLLGDGLDLTSVIVIRGVGWSERTDDFLLQKKYAKRASQMVVLAVLRTLKILKE